MVSGADNTTPLLQLIPKGGTDRLYPDVSQGGHLKWLHGAFVFNGVDSSYFYTLNNEGDVTRKAYIKRPDNARYFIGPFDRKNDGTIVAAVLPYDDDVSPYLTWIAPDGSTERMVKKAPYYPSLLTIAEDGTVWTLGFEAIHRRVDDPNLDPTNGVLRQFDSNGKLIASALPQSGFIGSNIKEMARLHFGRLCAFEKHLSWYSSLNGDSRYVEIPMEAIELHVFPGVSTEAIRTFPVNGVESLTVMGTGDVVVCLKGPGKRATFLFDRTNERWIRMTAPSGAGWHSYEPPLVGSEADNLVFSSGTWARFFGLATQESSSDQPQ